MDSSSPGREKVTVCRLSQPTARVVRAFVSGSSGLSATEVASFFRAMFKQFGWSVVFDARATDPSLNGTTVGQDVTGREILAKRGSTDGYYWEAGAVIPDQGSGAAIVSGSGASSTTPFIVQVFEIPDAD